MSTKKQKIIIEWSLTVSLFAIFIGHGFTAISMKQAWIPLLTVYGFSKATANTLLPMIGTMDICVAFLCLIKPLRIILIWAVFWAFATALSRPIAGEPIWEFIERIPNCVIPLMLLVIHEFPKKIKNPDTLHTFKSHSDTYQYLEVEDVMHLNK